jgi:hypothetical protein
MAGAEVQDFGFADNIIPLLHSNVNRPTNMSSATVVDDDDDSQGFFTTGLGDAPLEMFRIERAQLNLNITILQLVVSNNVLVMASTDSKLYKIDLGQQEQIVGSWSSWCMLMREMELQKKRGESKPIAKIFLDVHGHHLLANTEAGETFYFNLQSSKSGKGRPVTKLNNIHIESVAWNTEGTSASTKEILIGTRDGAIMETYLEISEYIPNARYLRQVRNFGTPIIGLQVEREANSDSRDVIIATHSAVTVFTGKVTRKNEEITPMYNTFFDDAYSGQFHPSSGSTLNSKIQILPRTTTESGYFAWTTSLGVFHGPIYSAKRLSDETLFADTTLLPYTSLIPNYNGTSPVFPCLSHYHLLFLHENTFIAVNRLSNAIVHKDRLSIVCLPPFSRANN